MTLLIISRIPFFLYRKEFKPHPSSTDIFSFAVYSSMSNPITMAEDSPNFDDRNKSGDKPSDSIDSDPLHTYLDPDDNSSKPPVRYPLGATFSTSEHLYQLKLITIPLFPIVLLFSSLASSCDTRTRSYNIKFVSLWLLPVHKGGS